MKQRTGFVSNSSSSSFIVLKRDISLSVEELCKRSTERYSKACGEEVSQEPYHQNKIKAFAEESKYVILIDRIEYGGEESIERMVPALLNAIGVNQEDISFVWDE